MHSSEELGVFTVAALRLSRQGPYLSTQACQELQGCNIIHMHHMATL